jgi:import inner membrane translocase subunit TIM17
MGGIQLLKKRAPMLGGNFCAWMGLFGTFQCVMLALTNKDTHMNQVVAGGLTGATINLRGGWRYAFRGGLQGAVFIGVFNIMEIFMTKSQAKNQIEQKKLQENYQMISQLSQIAQNRPELLTISRDEIMEERNKIMMQISEIQGFPME